MRFIVLAFIFVFFAIEPIALAQCGVTSGPGPTPWPTCTTWSGPSWGVKAPTYPVTTPSIIGTFEFNGDGLADIFVQSVTGGGVAVSTGSGFSAVMSASGVSTTCYNGNFDGSGRSGQACFNVNTGSTISYSTSTGTGYSSPTVINLPSGNLWDYQVWPANAPLSGHPNNPCLVMDVNGDGRDDIVCGYIVSIAAIGPSTAWGVYLATGNGFTYQVWSGPSGGYTLTPDCIIGDFNGDGLKDLACNWASTSSWNILLSTGAGWSAQIWTGPKPQQGSGYPGCNGTSAGQLCLNPCIVGDFDGDGISDIACNQGNNLWAIGFGGGVGGFKSNSSWAGTTPPTSFPLSEQCLVDDIFGVGRDGILCIANYGSSPASWTYLASSGTGFTATGFTTPWGSIGNLSQVCFVGDFNGDGIKDIACNLNNNSTWSMGLSSRPN